MKKIAIIAVPLFLAFLSPMVSVASVRANPIWITYGMYPWIDYKVTPSGLHIASDPIFFSADIPSIAPFATEATSYLQGWVTFVCSTERTDQKNAPKGFEYSITVKDIAAGTYAIKAYPTIEVAPDGTVIESSDLGIVSSYTLRTLNVGNSGEAELKGFYDLAGPAEYAWKITVELNGTPIFETHYADPIGFFVIS